MNILYSAMRTPDGTLLVSRNRHDYVTHEDANGKHYMLDGGLDYVRSSVNDDQEMITITDEDLHEVIREHLEWGTYGINGGQPLKYVKLKDMDDGHIQAVLDTQIIKPCLRTTMLAELMYRGIGE